LSRFAVIFLPPLLSHDLSDQMTKPKDYLSMTQDRSKKKRPSEWAFQTDDNPTANEFRKDLTE
jgi:hypothetical protein